jgi:F0F1-type ATP synthase membrane subunit b/b'
MVTMALAQADSPVLKAMASRQGVVKVQEALQQVSSDLDKVVGLNNNLVKDANARADAAERERRADERARLDRIAADARARLAREQALALATLKSEKGGKAPSKEIVCQNQLRNTLIPKLEEVLPIMERLNKEGKWNTLTSLLAIDPRFAEAEFKNDEEALKAIRTFAYFRSKEFETAGKALTRKEDAILAPIYRSDFRVYQAARGAILDGLKTMQQEQAGLEGMYPYIKEYNQILRGEVPQDIDIDKEREQAYEAIQQGVDINAVKKMFKQETGESLIYGED